MSYIATGSPDRFRRPMYAVAKRLELELHVRLKDFVSALGVFSFHPSSFFSYLLVVHFTTLFKSFVRDFQSIFLLIFSPTQFLIVLSFTCVSFYLSQVFFLSLGKLTLFFSFLSPRFY